MMIGAQFNVTVCQIFQSERLIKVSAILKLFSPNTPDGGSVSLKEFLHSFSSSEEFNDDILLCLDPHIEIIDEVETHVTLDTSLLQCLPFIAGYCVHSIFKSARYCKRGSCNDSSNMNIGERTSSICSQCLSKLCEEDTFDVGITDPVYGLIFQVIEEALSGLQPQYLRQLSSCGGYTPRSKWIRVFSVYLSRAHLGRS